MVKLCGVRPHACMHGQSGGQTVAVADCSSTGQSLLTRSRPVGQGYPGEAAARHTHAHKVHQGFPQERTWWLVASYPKPSTSAAMRVSTDSVCLDYFTSMRVRKAQSCRQADCVHRCQHMTRPCSTGAYWRHRQCTQLDDHLCTQSHCREAASSNPGARG